MKHYKIVKDGYILAIGIDIKGQEITKEEYEDIQQMIIDCPIANSGFGYRLTTLFQWEEYELPLTEEEATEQDYIAALEKLGVYAYA